MKINFRTITSVLLFGTLISIITGMAFYGMKIFDIESALFQFVSYGFIASLAFVLFKAQKYILSISVHIAMFIGLFYLTGQHYFLSHLIYYFSVLISFFIYTVLIFDHLVTAKYLRPLILATMLSIFFVSDTFLLSLIYSRSIGSSLVFKNMLVGLLIGLSVGIGIEVGYLLVKKEDEESED